MSTCRESFDYDFQNKYCEVFLLSLIREVTSSFYAEKCENTLSIEKLFDEYVKKIWGQKDLKDDKYIISLFDFSINWEDVYKSLRHKLDFYVEEDQKKAKELFTKAQNIINGFPKVEGRESKEFFPKKSDLIDYLSNYYQIVRFLFNHDNLLYEDIYYGSKEKKSETLCELLSHMPSKKNNSIYSLYCSEALLTLYNELPKLWKSSEEEHVDRFVKKMVESVFSVKAFRRFRHYVIRDYKQTLISCENTDHFLEKKSSNLSSFELFRPVRFFGKIKRFTQHFVSSKIDTVLDVSIIGAVYIDVKNLKEIENNIFDDEKDLKAFSYEMYRLYKWLCTDCETREVDYTFNIYMNRSGFAFVDPTILDSGVCFVLDKIKINFIFVDYNAIFRKSWFDKSIKENQLILLLDCPFIYDNTRIASKEVAFSDYVNSLPETYDENELALDEFGTVQNMQMQLNTVLLSNQGKIGDFDRKLRTDFLDYIKEAVSKKEHSEAFVFISSQRSINTSHYVRSYVVRTEKYNGKEIGLLHFRKFSNDSKSFITSGAISNSIVFTLWNIIVNNDVCLIEEWAKSLEKVFFNLGYNEDSCFENIANSICVEMIWKNDSTLFNEVDFRIFESSGSSKILNDEDVKKSIKSVIYSYFDLIFNSDSISKPVLNCMRNSFYNVFFSKIDNIYEVFAFQTMREKLLNSSKVKIGDISFADSESQEKNSSFELTQYKKIYTDVISNLSRAIPSKSLRDILVALMRYNGMDAYKTYDDIIETCESLGIKNSDLFKNTIEARKGL